MTDSELARELARMARQSRREALADIAEAERQAVARFNIKRQQQEDSK